MSDQQPSTEKATGLKPINILAQYVRDVSFENPLAPESLRSGLTNPEMDINIGMDARKIPDEQVDDLYESVINIRAAAMRDGEPVFVFEMQYGATVVLNGIAEQNIHPVLLIEIPRLMFPYVRQMVSDLTMQGGFPPLILNPVDFQALYMEQFKDEMDEAKQSVREDAKKVVKQDSKKKKDEKKTPAKTKK